MEAKKLNEKIGDFFELMFTDYTDNFFIAMVVLAIVSILYLTGIVTITIKCKILI